MAALLVLVALGGQAGAALDDYPRRLEYRIAWNGIPAAGATIDVASSDLAGHSGYVVQASAHTNAFVDLFWPFRGVARTTFLADSLQPLHFVYERTMDGVAYATWIDFDRDGRRARSVYMKRGERRREFDLDGAELLDPITAVFRALLSGATVGDTLRYEIFTGESRYRVVLTVKGPDTIQVPAGRFTALQVVPEVWKVGRVDQPDKRLRQATIWVAQDPSHTLLRIRSQVFIGAVTLDLVRVEPAA